MNPKLTKWKAKEMLKDGTAHGKYIRFTEDELKFLYDNCTKLTVVELSKILNKKVTSVRHKLYINNKTIINKNHKYTADDLEYIKNNAKTLDYSIIADKLNISRRMVQGIIWKNKWGKFRNKSYSNIIICTICKKEFPRTNEYFYFSRDGNLHSTSCKECCKIKNIKYLSVLDNYLKLLLRDINHNYKRNNKHGFKTNITLEYLLELYNKQKGLCAITGLKLEYGQKGGRNYYNLSIDRIDSSKGYIIGNIQLICVWANFAKQTLTINEFINFIKITYHNIINGEIQKENIERKSKINLAG